MNGVESLDKELGRVRFKASRLLELERLPQSEGVDLVLKLVETQLLVKVIERMEKIGSSS